MINIRISGRCGNQIFQYAFRRSLSLEYGEKINTFFRNIYRKDNSIFIRRGDFVNNLKNKLADYICIPDYFKRAIDKMNSMVKNPRYIVFSDDINLIKEKHGFS